MGTCCIHTEVNHRNCTPAPISNPGSCRPESPTSYPTPPPFSLHPPETKDVRSIIAHFAGPNKELTGSQFSRPLKNKALTASTQGLHREALTAHRILQGTPTLVSFYTWAASA